MGPFMEIVDTWSPVSNDTQVYLFSNVCVTNINLQVGYVRFWLMYGNEKAKWNWSAPKRTND